MKAMAGISEKMYVLCAWRREAVTVTLEVVACLHVLTISSAVHIDNHRVYDIAMDCLPCSVLFICILLLPLTNNVR